MGEREAVGELELQASAAALRALADQEARLRDVRTQTATLLAAALVCTSLFSAHGSSSLLGGVSVVAFIVALLAALYTLMPSDRFVFALGGTEVYGELGDARDDPSEIHRLLVCWMEWFRWRNQPILGRKARSYRVALISFGVQAAALAAELYSGYAM